MAFSSVSEAISACVPVIGVICGVILLAFVLVVIMQFITGLIQNM